jgi:hypothetical protein
VFTARYALSPYIKQIRFVFKGWIDVFLIFVNIPRKRRKDKTRKGKRRKEKKRKEKKGKEKKFIIVSGVRKETRKRKPRVSVIVTETPVKVALELEVKAHGKPVKRNRLLTDVQAVKGH